MLILLIHTNKFIQVINLIISCVVVLMVLSGRRLAIGGADWRWEAMIGGGRGVVGGCRRRVASDGRVEETENKIVSAVEESI